MAEEGREDPPNIPREEEREFHQLVEQGQQILQRLDGLTEGLGTIAATLLEFLTQWEAANTSTPAIVTIKWGEPQPKPEGT